MTREIKYTTSSFSAPDEDSCYLDPNDPIHEFMRTGNVQALNQPKKINLDEQHQEYQRKLKLAREQGIRPGSPAWFLL